MLKASLRSSKMHCTPCPTTIEWKGFRRFLDHPPRRSAMASWLGTSAPAKRIHAGKGTMRTVAIRATSEGGCSSKGSTGAIIEPQSLGHSMHDVVVEPQAISIASQVR